MNIDLLTNQQVLTLYTTQWCRQYGIKPCDLGCSTAITVDGKIRPYQNAHPAIDDVIILIKFRDAYWQHMSKAQKQTWESMWEWTYTLKRSSRQKHLSKLESMTFDIENNITYTNLKAQARKERARSKIKALRQQTS